MKKHFRRHGVCSFSLSFPPVYVDMGTGCGDSVTLNFGFTGASTVRTWEIKVSQIPCGSDYT